MIEFILKHQTKFLIYGIIAFIYGIYSIFMQIKHHPNSVQWWKLLLVFIINFLGMPFTIPIAIKNKQLW